MFYFLYEWYTTLQVKSTPKLQQMLTQLHDKYGDDIPEEIRLKFRAQSKQLMKKYIDLLTFDGRTLVMFVIVLSGFVWVYYLYEILVLNTVVAISIKKHESLCESLLDK